MPSHQIVVKRLINLEDSLSQSYKYAIHAEILQAFSLLPWLISTTDLVEKILPILRIRIQSVASLFDFLFTPSLSDPLTEFLN